MSVPNHPLARVDARIRDIQPNQPSPTLELYFSPRDSDWLASEHGAEVQLEIDGVQWLATLGIKPPNPPYLHSRLRGERGSTRVTDLMCSMGLAPGARVRFRVLEPGVLQLDEILERGAWPAGPRQRTATRARTAPEPRMPVEARATSPGQSEFPFADRASIERWAARYWTLISARESSEERAFEREMPGYRERGRLGKEMFVRLARWKSPRKTPDYESNTDSAVEDASRRAFSAASDAEAIRALTGLRGVALRTATALLHWMRPDEFPILDFRVVGALGLPEPSNWESTDFYTQVADRIRRIASSNGVDLRTLDRALWAWDKAGGGATRT